MMDIKHPEKGKFSRPMRTRAEKEGTTPLSLALYSKTTSILMVITEMVRKKLP